MAGFTTTGSLQTPRRSFRATRLDGGQVLVAGGSDSDGAGVRSAEVYDPATGTWSSAGVLHGDHVSPQLVATDHGAALVGGDPAGADVLLETWDMTTNVWTSHIVDPLLAAADGARFSTDHLDVVCGVRGSVDALGTGRFVEVSLTNGAVTPLPTPGYDRSHAFVRALADGTVLCCSGVGAAVGSAGATVEYLTRTSERYDPADGTWRATGRLAVPHQSLDRVGECLVVLDVDALMVAGSDQIDRYTDVVEHFSSANGRWTRRTPLPDRRDLHTTTSLGSGTVLVIGGEGETGVRSDGYAYDVATDVWSPLDAMSTPRLGHAAVVLPDDSVLIVGGTDDGSCELLA